MNWPDLEDEAQTFGLFVMGALQDGEDTVILIGADVGMWQIFKASVEFSDGQAHPLDRWSKRVLAVLAQSLGATCQFPSDGPPYLPFIAWAKDTGRFWQSPTGMLIHDTAGLMISIRGALRIANTSLPQTTKRSSPCDTCITKPCTTACPVDALNAHSFYDVPTCKTHLNAPEGANCMDAGCLARRACPVSQSYARDPEQSAFHMRAFV